MYVYSKSGVIFIPLREQLAVYVQIVSCEVSKSIRFRNGNDIQKYTAGADKNRRISRCDPIKMVGTRIYHPIDLDLILTLLQITESTPL